MIDIRYDENKVLKQNEQKRNLAFDKYLYVLCVNTIDTYLRILDILSSFIWIFLLLFLKKYLFTLLVHLHYI